MLVVAGERDPFLPWRRLADAVRRRLPAGQTVVIPGAGHLLPHDRPVELADLLASFLGERDLTEPGVNSQV